MKLLCTIAALIAGVFPLVAAAQSFPFQNPSLPTEQRIDNFLSLLSAQEKVDLLGKSINLPRLGLHAEGSVATIPGSGGQFEGLHGLAVDSRWGKKSPGGDGPMGGVTAIPTTQFPEPAGMGETWDPALIEQAAHQEAVEARYIFQRYDRGGLIVRAPNADLARDPRWGRSEESYGEDPYLVGTFAVAFVHGLQGDDPHYWLTSSLVKHFMANSNEDGRGGSSSNFDARLLHEYYAMPFRMAVEQGGANAIMASYNAVNKIPMTANPMLRTLLMQRWGFNGLIDTDRGAVTNMVTQHHYYPDMNAAVAGAIHAGVNQFLNEYEGPLHADLADGQVTEAQMDANLRGLLRVFFRLGFFDPPAMDPYSGIGKGDGAAPWDAAAAHDLALRITRASIVLLKNAPVGDVPAGGRKPLLPLDASAIHSIAVVGPRANTVYIDGYGGQPPFAITPLKGIRSAAGANVQVQTAADHDQAVALARSSDVAVVVLGNDPMWRARFGTTPDPTEGLEAIDRKEIHLNPEQEKLLEDVRAANPRTIAVIVSGFPYAIPWAAAHVPAIVHMAHCSEQEGAALADILFGRTNPAGRLTVTWPAALADEPPMMDYNLLDGRTYMYFRHKPLFAFGHGLSYTTFRYAHLLVSSSKLVENGAITVSVRVSNTGQRAGDEVVQMYVQHVGSKVARPREALKGFARIALQPGETKTVELPLAARDLAYWNEAANQWTVEQDHVRVMIGGASDAIVLSKVIAVAP